MVDVFCIHVHKLNNETCGNCSKKRGGELRENDGGVNLLKMHSRHICKYHNDPSTPAAVQLVYTDKKSRSNTCKNRQLTLCQAQSLLHSKGKNRIIRQPVELEEIFANHIFDKVLISKMIAKRKTFH
jgi:hypothetical protein